MVNNNSTVEPDLGTPGGGLSDFCRRGSGDGGRRRSPPPPSDHSPGKRNAERVDGTSSHDPQNENVSRSNRRRSDELEEGASVWVQILSSCPLTSLKCGRCGGSSGNRADQKGRDRRRRIRRRRRGGERRSVRRDEFATVYAESIDLLAEMEVFEGQICSLRHSSDCRDFWAPVILRTLPSYFHTDGGEDRGGGAVHGESLPPTRPIKLFVPPCVAASAGLFDFAPRHLRECARIRPIRATNDLFCRGPAVKHRYRVPHATRATLREIGVPILDLMPESLIEDIYFGQKQAFVKTHQEEALRSFFRDRGANEGRPRLLAKGSVIGVPSFVPESHNCTQRQYQTRFYEVVLIEVSGTEFGGSSDIIVKNGLDVSKHRNGPALLSPPFYVISPKTELTLQGGQVRNQGEIFRVRRLPQLSIAEAFSRSIFDMPKEARESGENEVKTRDTVSNCEHGAKLNLHPSANCVANALLLPSLGSSSYALADLVLHVIGTEDDHTHQCLDSAADIAGMRILHVDGLAAFSYSYRTRHHDDQKSNFTLTGGIGDKVAGLGRALDVALESAPCVLHVSRFDRELTTGDDHDTRWDEEGRFLACITDALRKSQCHRDFVGVRKEPVVCGRDSVAFAPAIVVVLSTANPLREGGPLSSFLSCEASFVLRPNEAYAHELWSRALKENKDDCLFEEVKSHLLGRTASEISFISQRYSAATKVRCSISTTPSKLVGDIAKCTEGGPSEGAGGSSASKLANSLVPDVRWEDVGGLSHVRAEVTDAVELPLRYPHLFQGSSGRSGLLLFGPPGTGKTLVAKAVATECGLPFLSVKGPELLGSYVGESEANVRAAFAAAREAAAARLGRRLESGEMADSESAVGGCAILFFDELDSLAPRRGGVGDGGGVMERVVATLLGELDGATSTEGSDSSYQTASELGRAASKGTVFVIGATNRPDLLDPSLLRPGRFDRLVYLGPAQEKEDRVRILMAQTRKFRFQDGTDPEESLGHVVDSLPPALSGADLSAISKGALMRSLKRLCDEAEEEASSFNSSSLCERGEDELTESRSNAPLSVESIISGWDEKRLEPIVRIEDFIAASKEVSPSVTEDDLLGYEGLRKRFCA